MKKDYFHLTVRQSLTLLIPIENTAEVVTCLRKDICPIPGVVPPLRGVLNQRGKLLWTLGLGDLLGLAPQQEKKRPQDKLTIVILNSPDETNASVGGIISELKGIVSLSEETIKPVPEKMRSKARHFLTGVTAIEQQKAVVINVARIFQYLQKSSLANRSLVSL